MSPEELNDAKLSGIVEEVNQLAENLVASSEQTTASIGSMRSVTGNVEESLAQMLANN